MNSPVEIWGVIAEPALVNKRIIVDDDQFKRSIVAFNRTELIFACSKLCLATNSSIAGNDLHSLQLACLAVMKHDGMIDMQSYQKLTAAMIAQQNPMMFAISRSGVQEVIRAAAAWGRDDISTNWLIMQPHVSRHLITSLLLGFKLYNRREMEPHLLITVDSVENKRRIAAPAMRSAVSLAPPTRELLLYLGRGLSLLEQEFFSKHPSYRTDFERHGLTVTEYISCVAGTMLVGVVLPYHKLASGERLVDCFEFGINNLIAESPASRQLFDRYYKLESQSIDDLFGTYGETTKTAEFFDRKPLRSKPVFRNSLERMIVMDEVFLAERASVGPLFHTLKDGEGNQNRQKFADFGKACERYASMLIDRYQQDCALRNEETNFVSPVFGFRNQPNDELIDGFLSDKYADIIFETKGVWLRDEILYSGDVDRFWDLVTEQYSVGVDRKGKPVRHGVAQLFDFIDGLISRMWIPDNKSVVLSTTKPIIPVLVVHDETISSAPLMINSLALELASLFELAALPNCGCFQHRGYRIHSLVLITLNELEILQGIRHKAPLSQFLLDYSRRNPERGQDLREYIHVVYNQRFHYKHSFLQEAAQEALNKVSETIFGKSLSAPDSR